LQHDGSSYARFVGASPNFTPRQAATIQFYRTHSDSYDFIIAFPAFDADFAEEGTLGLHWPVKNDASGTGHDLFDATQAFGSQGRLKALIDVAALNPNAQLSLPTALDVIAHEVAHEWSGKARFLDPATAAISTDLLGREGSHWSRFLSSQASVLYGSDWLANGDGTFTAGGFEKRYSDLDLYLMGLLAPQEVSPFTLLQPLSQGAGLPTDLPAAPGTVITARTQSLGIADVIAAEGPRLPVAGEAQSVFRSAFVVLLAPGQAPTQAQLDFVDAVRREWTNQFFFLTRGRAVMETELVEAPPRNVPVAPGTAAGLAWLLSHQLQDGSWADGPETAVRETQEAIQALATFTDSRVPPALARAVAFLANTVPSDADSAARRILGLFAAGSDPSAAVSALRAVAPVRDDSGSGLVPGYGSTVIDTALTVRALSIAGGDPSIAARTQFLLAQQGRDGGWPYLRGGPGRIEPTALAIQILSQAPSSAAIAASVRNGVAFLAARIYGGDFLDDRQSPAATAFALFGLRDAGQLPRAFASIDALLAQQGQDGSWLGSVHQTALALTALRRLSVPDLAISSGGISLPAAATDGEIVFATVSVRNAGFALAPSTVLRIFDSSGTAMGSAPVPALGAGLSSDVIVQLDTSGHAGSTLALAVIDPDGQLDELRKDNNRAAVPFAVLARPEGVDLFVAAGSAVVTPSAIARLPGAVQVTAQVGNLGRQAALGVPVVLLLQGLPAGTAMVDLPAGSRVPVTLAGAVQNAQSTVAFEIVIDPQQSVPQTRHDNDRLAGTIPVTATLDVAVAGLQLVPSPVDRGRDLSISFLLVNHGTRDATAATASVLVTAGGQRLDHFAPLRGLFIPAGGSIARTLTWRADVAGPALVGVRSSLTGAVDADPSNDVASAPIVVLQSSLPNLIVDSISLSPPDAPVGQPVTASVAVRNTGVADAGAFIVDLTLDDGSGSHLLGHLPVAGLPAGGNATVSTTFTPTHATQSSLFAAADPDNRVAEFAEDDNLGVLTFTPAALPDLALDASDVRPSTFFPRAQAAVSVRVTVHNAGEQAARSVPVELFLGAPESGGLIGSALLDNVAPKGSSDAVFTWNTGQAAGAQTLTAVVDRAGTLSEQRTDNNRAARRVMVQDGVVALSNPIFSPNGDGVKDSTEVFFNLAQTGPVTVTIADARGAVLRTLQGQAGQTGSLIWDGRDDRGAVVFDGSYQLAVASGSTPVGTVSVVVDCNQSQIQEVLGTDLVRDQDLFQRIPGFADQSPGVQGLPGQPMPDDSGLVFKTANEDLTDCAFTVVPIAGDPYRLAEGPWVCEVRAFTLRPGLLLDTRLVANETATETHALDLRTGSDTVILGVEVGLGAAVSPDGRTLAANVLDFPPGPGQITSRVDVVTTDGSEPPRALLEAGLFFPTGRNGYSTAFTADSSSLGVIAPGGAVQQVSLNGGLRTLAPPGTSTVCRHDCLGWSPDGATLYAATANYSVNPGGEGGPFAVAEMGFIEAIDAASGAQREVFRTPPRLPDEFSTWSGPMEIAPRGDVLLLSGIETPQSLKFTGLYLLSTAGGEPTQVYPQFGEAHWSPRGSFLIVGTHALTSLANQATTVTANQPAGSSAIVFRGTATDANFEQYSISVQPLSGGASTEIVRSATPVVDGVLASWTPPRSGVYRATLTALDQAGNVRTDTAVIGYSQAPVINNVRRDPEFISPNGDGVQDSLLVSYSVAAPTTADFRIVAATGAVVRRFTRVHTAAGDSSFSWDGRDDSGQLVPDGSYALQVGSTLLPVTVDVTPPTVLLQPIVPLIPVTTNGTLGWRNTTFVPGLELAIQWKSDDANLESWTLEESAPGQGFGPVASGTTRDVRKRTSAVQSVIGRVARLRARDHAGNESVGELTYDTEHLVASAVQHGSGVTEKVENGLPDGRNSFDFAPEVYRIFLRHGISTRLVSFQAITETQAVALVPLPVDPDLGDLEVDWDARLVQPPGPVSITVRALDELGRTFEDFVLLRPRSPLPSATMDACLTGPFSAKVQVLAKKQNNATPDSFAEGRAFIEFLPLRDGRQQPAELSLPLPAFIGGTALDVDLSPLSGCQYVVSFRGIDDDRQPLAAALPQFDICDLQFGTRAVNGNLLSLSLAESFRSPLRSADVYRRHHGDSGWTPLTSFGTFRKQSATQLVPLPPETACSTQDLRIVAHFADGTSADTMVPDPRVRTCAIRQPPPDTVDVSCLRVLVHKPVREPAGPFCTARDATWTAQIDADGNAPIDSISARAQSLMAGTAVTLSTTPAKLASSTSTVATFVTAGVPEGRYVIAADALDRTGAVGHGIDSSNAIVVDHTPPSVSVASPAANAVVCAMPAQAKDGSSTRRFEVSGSVSDANLEAYTVLLRSRGGAWVARGGDSFAAPKPFTATGVLASVDASSLESGDYELTVDARDASGGSVCAPPVPIHLDKDLHLTDASASASIFSPDADGTLDADDLSFALDEAADVRITAEPLEGGSAVEVVHRGFTAGSQTFRWDGAATPDGAYTLRLHGVDACNNQSELTLPVVVDTAAPVTRIDAPAEGGAVSAVLEVHGEASDANLDSWQLAVGAGDSPATFTPLAQSSVSSEGLLGAFPTAGLIPGRYTLRLTADDRAGHHSEVRGHFVVAAGALIGSLSVNPPAISPAAGRTVTATLSLLHPATVQLALVDAQGNVAAIAADGVALPAGVSPLIIGSGVLLGLADRTYAVRAVATAPGASDTATSPLVIDRVAPQLAISLPAAGSFVRGGTAVAANISDPGLASWTLSLRAAGGAQSTLAAGSSSRSGTVAVLQSLADGTYHLLLHATDAAGNSADLDVPFTSDSTAPAVAFIAPLDGDFISGGSGLVSVRAAVTDTNLKAARLSVISSGMEQVLFDGPSFSGASWDAASTPDGPAELTLRAEDLAGNVTTAAITVAVDSTPPQVHIAAPRDGFAGTPLRFTGTVQDANLASWTLSLGQGPDLPSTLFVQVASGKANLASGELLTLARAPADGAYTARLEAVDRLGNHASDSAGFVVDTTPPAAPQGLVAAVTGRDIQLSWTATAGSDLAGYRILRAGSFGTPAQLSTDLVAGPSYTDHGRPDGVARYQVVAVDQAGNSSPPSAEVRVEVDAVPPQVAILQPAAGAAVSGTLQVLGTAQKPRGFASWRLSIGDGAAPSTFASVAESPLSIIGGALANIDTRAFAQASMHTLLLVADDASGNHAETRSTFTVDNVAPGAPLLLSAIPSGSAVTISWQPSGDADLSGVLVYRNGAIANAPPGASIRTVGPYVIPVGTTSWTDPNVPDGLHTYQVRAVDRAGNLGALSNSIAVNLERHAPGARIGTPEPLTRISGLTRVVAAVDDLDVVQVQVQVRAGTTSFQPLGPPLTQFPYAVDLDPALFTSPVIELRAIATDQNGNSTAVAAAPITAVFFDSALAQPAVSASVNADAITVRWTDSDPAGRVGAYLVKRNGAVDGPSPALPAGSVAASSGDPRPGYDGDSQTAWSATSPGAAFFRLTFASPVMVDEIQALLGADGVFDAQVRVKNVWVTAARALQSPRSSTRALSLGGPLLIDAVELDFAASGTAASLSELTVVPSPGVPGSPVVLYSSDQRTHALSVQALSPFGSLSPPGTAPATVFAPTVVQPEPGIVVGTTIPVSGSRAGPGASVAIYGGTSVVSVQADANGAFSAVVPLLPYQDSGLYAQSTLASGDVSLPSNTVFVTSRPPPAAHLALSATVSGADVSFSFAVTGDLSHLTWLELFRAPHGGQGQLVAFLPGTGRSYVDSPVPNGTWDYTLVGFDNLALPGGTPSPPVTVTISMPVPEAPRALAVTAPAGGSELDLSWIYDGAVPAAYFAVDRDDGSGFADLTAVAASPWADTGVKNGVAYAYRVRAVDAAGNEGPRSNLASGTPRRTTPVAPPLIHYPATPVSPALATSADTAVAGRSEPGTRVEVFRAGASLGATTTSHAQPSRELALAATQTGDDLAVSSDGSLVAYVSNPNSWESSVAIERLGGAALQTVRQPGLRFQKITFSPDGTQVAAVAQPPGGLQSIYIIAVADGSVRPLVPSSTRREVLPAWSSDNSTVAYLTDAAGLSGLAVADVISGAERVIAAIAAGTFDQPTFFGTGALAAIEQRGDGMSVVTFDLASGVRTDLYAAPNIYALAASPSGDRLAVATDQLLLVDAAGGVVPVDGAGSYPSLLAFSPEGSELAFQAPWLGLADVGGHAAVVDQTFATGGRLFVVAPGRVAVWSGSPFVQEFDGFFSLPVQLVPGDNIFTAVASTASASSEPSDPVLVRLDPGQLPDLSVTLQILPAVPVAGGSAQAAVRIDNLGGVESDPAGILVQLVTPDGTVRNLPSLQVGPVAPGTFATLVTPLDLSGLSGAATVVAVVDPSATFPDGDRSNNRAQLDFTIATTQDPILLVSLDRRQVAANGTVNATVQVLNPGPLRSLTVSLALEDGAGIVAIAAPDENIASLPSGAQTSFSRSFAIGTMLAGAYQVVVTAGTARASAPVTVAADLTATLALETAHATFLTGETVEIDARIANASVNSILSGASFQISVLDGQGTAVFAPPPTTLPPLARGTSMLVPTLIALPGLPPGSYDARATLSAGGATLATASAPVRIVGRPLLEGAISVAGRGTPPAVPSGADVVATVQVQNSGTAGSDGVVVHTAVVDPDSGAVLLSHDDTVGHLAPLESFTQTVRLASSGLSLKTYAAVLSVDHDGSAAPDALGSQGFRIADSAAPVVMVQSPTPGMYLRGSAHPVARALDDSSGVALVTVSVDGLPVPMQLLTGSALDGTWSVPIALSPDGQHVLGFSAADAEGNVSAPVMVTVVSDSIPPVLTVSGVQDGAIVRGAVTPVFAASDANLASLTATLNGAPFTSATTIGDDGDYRLVVQASDRAANVAIASIGFSIDRTPPLIVIAGVTDGEVASQAVTPTFTVTDAHLAIVDARLDGLPFVSGTTVSQAGAHVLTVSAQDLAGNAAQATVHFSIGSNPPQIVLTGVTDRSIVNSNVTPVFSAGGATVVATLNGGPFTSGTTITADGDYTLRITATDAVGLTSVVVVGFIIDKTAPAITVSGVAPGAYVNLSSVTLSYASSDANPGTTTATLDGAAFASGGAVSAEGAHSLVVTATDLAGNSATRTVTFTIDRTAPVIVAGAGAVTDGAYLRTTSVNATYTETDANPGPVACTLDAIAVSCGTITAAAGSHNLVVTASDLAGNQSTRTVGFVVDLTVPVVSLTAVTNAGAAVTNGAVVNASSVTVSYSVSDSNPGSVTATLDGVAFASGAVVSSAADHSASVSATDKAGNSSNASLAFAIDRTPPAITVTGVTEGATYNAPVTPVISFADAHLTTTSSQLDGQPFTSGTTVGTAGAHTLTASAVDAAGNSSQSTVHFAIVLLLQVNKSLPAKPPLRLALIKAGQCALSSSEQTRVRTFLNTYIGASIQETPSGPLVPVLLQIDTDETTFLGHLRSGQYGSIIWVDLTNTSSSCAENNDATCTSALCATRRSMAREMTELAYSGKAGVVLIRNRAEALPTMDELLGTDVNGAVSASGVTFNSASPLGPLPNLSVGSPLFSLKLLTGGASASTYTGVTSPKTGGPFNAAVTRTLLQGKAVSFGYDLTKATTATNAANALLTAVNVVTPVAPALKPLSIAFVRIDVTRDSSITSYYVQERVPGPTAFVSQMPQPPGACSDTSVNGYWRGGATAASPSLTMVFEYLARVPDQAGTFPVRTTVGVTSSCDSPPNPDPRAVDNTLQLSVAENGAGLLADANAAAAALPSTGGDGTVRANIQQKLSAVGSRVVTTKTDAEANLTDLLAAVDQAKTLTVDPTAMRLALDELIRYWEARWSAL